MAQYRFAQSDYEWDNVLRPHGTKGFFRGVLGGSGNLYVINEDGILWGIPAAAINGSASTEAEKRPWPVDFTVDGTPVSELGIALRDVLYLPQDDLEAPGEWILAAKDGIILTGEGLEPKDLHRITVPGITADLTRINRIKEIDMVTITGQRGTIVAAPSGSPASAPARSTRRYASAVAPRGEGARSFVPVTLPPAFRDRDVLRQGYVASADRITTIFFTEDGDAFTTDMPTLPSHQQMTWVLGEEVFGMIPVRSQAGVGVAVFNDGGFFEVFRPDPEGEIVRDDAMVDAMNRSSAWLNGILFGDGDGAEGSFMATRRQTGYIFPPVGNEFRWYSPSLGPVATINEVGDLDGYLLRGDGRSGDAYLPRNYDNGPGGANPDLPLRPSSKLTMRRQTHLPAGPLGRTPFVGAIVGGGDGQVAFQVMDAGEIVTVWSTPEYYDGVVVDLLSHTPTGNLFAMLSTGRFYLSKDGGRTWRQRFLPDLFGVGFTAATATASGLLVAVGSGGLVVASDNGEDWAPVNANTGGVRFADIAYGNGKLVAVASSGTIATAAPTDLTAWQFPFSKTVSDLTAVTWAGTHFIAVGQGVVVTSPDGTEWTKVPAGGIGDGRLLDVAYDPVSATVHAVGERGLIASSAADSGFSTWTTSTLDTEDDLTAIRADAQGTLYLGTSAGHLFLSLETGAFQFDSSHGGRIYDIEFRAPDLVFLGGAGGLLRRRGTLPAPETAYAIWRRQTFNAEDAASDLVSGPAADPEPDGRDNFAEFLMDSDPLAPDPGPATPEVLGDMFFADIMSLQVAISRDATDVLVRVESSADLRTWAPESAVPTVFEGDNIFYSFDIPVAGDLRRFFRVRFALPVE